MIQHTTILSLPTAAIAGTKAEAAIAKTTSLSPKRHMFKDIHRMFKDIPSMSSNIPRMFKDIGCMFEDIDRMFEDIDRMSDHIDRMFKDIRCMFENIDRMFDHIDRMFEDIGGMFENIDRMFENIQRLGDKRRFSSEVPPVDGASNISKTTVRTAYCRGSPGPGAHVDNYTKQFFPHKLKQTQLWLQ
jgi:hypothetical protein